VVDQELDARLRAQGDLMAQRAEEHPERERIDDPAGQDEQRWRCRELRLGLELQAYALSGTIVQTQRPTDALRDLSDQVETDAAAGHGSDARCGADAPREQGVDERLLGRWHGGAGGTGEHGLLDGVEIQTAPVVVAAKDDTGALAGHADADASDRILPLRSACLRRLDAVGDGIFDGLEEGALSGGVEFGLDTQRSAMKLEAHLLADGERSVPRRALERAAQVVRWAQAQAL